MRRYPVDRRSVRAGRHLPPAGRHRDRPRCRPALGMVWYASCSRRLARHAFRARVRHRRACIRLGQDRRGARKLYADRTGDIRSVSSRQTHAGWTIGGGIEAMFGGNWSGKLEYLYMDLGSFDNTVALAAPPIGAAISSRLTDNIFRAGINYHFSAGPGGRALLIVLPANKASGTFSVPLASTPSWSGRPRSSS